MPCGLRLVANQDVPTNGVVNRAVSSPCQIPVRSHRLTVTNADNASPRRRLGAQPPTTADPPRPPRRRILQAGGRRFEPGTLHLSERLNKPFVGTSYEGMPKGLASRWGQLTNGDTCPITILARPFE